MGIRGERKDEENLIIRENRERYKKVFGRCNQYTGFNMEGHTHKVECKDFWGLETQWVTDETYNDPLWQQLIECGTIRKLTEKYNDYYASTNMPEVTENEIYEVLVYTRLATDPSFAFYMVFSIKYKRGGQGAFILNYAQRYVLSILEDLRHRKVPIRIVLLKARQWGGSTLIQLYMAWIQLFVKEQWYSVIIAQTKNTSIRIKAMYQKTLENIPAVVFHGNQIKFTPYNGSHADSILTDGKGHVMRDNVITTSSYESYENERGMDYAMFHGSEVAFWKTTPSKSAEDVITNLDSNILEEADTIEVLESTPKGAAGFFYNEYQDAKAGRSNRVAIFIPFTMIENDSLEFESDKKRREFARKLVLHRHQKNAPDNRHESGEYLYSLWQKGATLEHIHWYVTKRPSFSSHAQMAQEAPSDDEECFTYSGNRLFSPTVVQFMRDKYEKDPMWVGDIVERQDGIHLLENAQGSLWIWKKPDKIKAKRRYLVVVDCGGRMHTSDYNVITVVDRWATLFKDGKPEVVARWRGHMRYDEMAYKAVSVAKYYDNALLAFESNTFDRKKAIANEFIEQGDHILGILNKIREIYPNLYMRKATNPEDIRQGILQKVGFQTNRKTKQEMVDEFCVEFEEDRWIDHDSRFYAEANIYEEHDEGGYGNIEGRDENGERNHDDIIDTDMIAALIIRDMEAPAIEDDVESYYNETIDTGELNESAL